MVELPRDPKEENKLQLVEHFTTTQVYVVGVDVLPVKMGEHMNSITIGTNRNPIFVLLGKEDQVEIISEALMNGIGGRSICSRYGLPNGDKLLYIMKAGINSETIEIGDRSVSTRIDIITVDID